MNIYQRDFWLGEPGTTGHPVNIWYSKHNSATVAAVQKVRRKFNTEQKIQQAGRPWKWQSGLLWALVAAVVVLALVTESLQMVQAGGPAVVGLYYFIQFGARAIVRHDRKTLIRELAAGIHGPFMAYGDPAWAALDEKLETEHQRSLASVLRYQQVLTATIQDVSHFLMQTRVERGVIRITPKMKPGARTALEDRIATHAAPVADKMAQSVPQPSRQ